MDKIYNLEDRLIRFAGEVIFFCKTLPNSQTSKHYGDQIMRSSGSTALNFGEAQGSITDKDFIHKMSLVLKGLKETGVALKILDYVEYGDAEKRKMLITEANELSRISATMILNKKRK
ncbi:MAG: four helix bundle protein [Saprospiraceae bacterium]|nr:four helix bundle protein [Saprospiraceae bacterium]